MVFALRVGSEQVAQTSWSVIAWQIAQVRMPSRSVPTASDRRVVSSRDTRIRWKAMRWADFGPIPGSFRSSSISRATGAG